MKKKTILFTSVLFTGCTLCAQGQSPAVEAPRLVRLNVLAFDSRGQAVGDLTADDLKVTDRGKVQRLVSFRNEGATQQSAPLAPGQLSNRPSPVPQTTAVLLDFLNTNNQSNRLTAVRQIGQSLKQLESGESVYFYILALDGVLHPIRENTAPAKTWNQQIESLLADAIKTLPKARPSGLADEEGVKKTYVALETVANQLAAFPGKRDILWVTERIPNVWSEKNSSCSGDWIECALYVPHLSVTLDHAGVVVDPASFSTLDPTSTRYMEEMATITGGRAFFGEDTRAILKRFADQAGATYAIAYDPSKENWDSKFHTVKVTCERKGVKLQVRQRYYALPDQRPPSQAALITAYQMSSDANDIGLRGSVSKGSAPNTVSVALNINPADIQFREQSGAFDDQLTVLFSARTAKGPVSDPTITSFNLHLTPEQHTTVMKESIPIVREYPIGEGIQVIRMIILDHATNAVGSLTMPVR